MDGAGESIRIPKATHRTRQDLADDIKMSILEGMCPAEVERHLQLNRSKFPDFDDMHSELATYWKPALV